jgi:hypothetical protein
MFAHVSFAARLFASREQMRETRRSLAAAAAASAFSLLDLSPLCAFGDEQPNSLRKSRDGAPGFAEFPLKTLFMCPLLLYSPTHAKAAPACALVFFLLIFPVFLVGKTGRRRAGADLYQNRWREMQGM